MSSTISAARTIDESTCSDIPELSIFATSSFRYCSQPSSVSRVRLPAESVQGVSVPATTRASPLSCPRVPSAATDRSRRSCGAPRRVSLQTMASRGTIAGIPLNHDRALRDDVDVVHERAAARHCRPLVLCSATAPHGLAICGPALEEPCESRVTDYERLDKGTGGSRRSLAPDAVKTELFCTCDDTTVTMMPGAARSSPFRLA